uniref:WD repeat domain 4 n=1 Tax=Nothobranchius kuhntae TaxID=321403 RepID=A0A1A8HSS3_NOTKU
MTSVRFCRDWFLLSCNKKLVAVHTKESREPFVFDCSDAEKPPKSLKDDGNSNNGSTEETGSDEVLAIAVSSSGKLVALTDDTKRLVLFECEPSWRCISTRWVVRRCVSLVFSQAEDELLVADKSGDVYSFSVVEPQAEGELKMGHLSMLLSMVVSPDDKFIITADRDEKIRVSHRRSPYNIQSFCLGHRQFVSTLHIPPSHPHWLLSGSGDGTMKLWEFESGRRLQSWDLSQLDESQSSDPDKNTAVVRIISSSDGCHVAVLCEGVSEALRPHWNTAQESTRTSRRFEHLYKMGYDNVSVYLQKKQQRLEEQQQKRVKAQTSNRNKRLKKDASA